MPLAPKEDITYEQAAEYINTGRDILASLFTDELPTQLKLDICIGFMLDVIDTHYTKEDPSLSDAEVLKSFIDSYTENFYSTKETVQ